MPDFADRLVEELDDLIDGHAGLFRSCLDAEAAAKVIREHCAGILTAAALLKRPIQPCPCCTVMMPKGTLHICREPSIENVDSELRAAGLDPDEVGRRGADLVARLRRPHEDGPTRLTEGGEATVNKDTGTVRIAAGKGIVNGEPVSWEASEQAYELIEKPSAEDGDEDAR